MQPNKAIVGANAFAHESGIHQDGMLKHAGTYEIMTPESVGLIALDAGDGQAFRPPRLQATSSRSWASSWATTRSNDAFRRFKDLADKKKDVFDEDIVALVDDEVVRGNDRIRFVSLQVDRRLEGAADAPSSSSRSTASAQRDDATGDGPVDATFKAIKQLFPHDATLAALPGPCGDRGHRRAGRGDGAARGGRQDGQRPGRRHRHAGRVGKAYVHALNKLLMKRQKTAPAALSA